MQKILADYEDDVVSAVVHPVHQVQETSREAYRDLLCHPLELNGRYREYLDALQSVGYPATDQEVSRYMGHGDPNYFRPRRNELVKMGVVRLVGKRKCGVSGKAAMVWWFE